MRDKIEERLDRVEGGKFGWAVSFSHCINTRRDKRVEKFGVWSFIRVGFKYKKTVMEIL